MANGAYGSGWVGLMDFFDLTQKFELVGFHPTPNFSQPNTLFLGWVVKNFKKKFYLFTVYNYSDIILDKIY